MDDPLPADILKDWNLVLEELPLLSNLSIPRHVLLDNIDEIQLCGFSDASELGFGAVVYYRILSLSGEITTYMLGSKSEVAPTTPITIPRLELCGALLLAQWMHRLTTALEMKVKIT